MNHQIGLLSFLLFISHFSLPISHFPYPTSHFPLLTSHFPFGLGHSPQSRNTNLFTPFGRANLVRVAFLPNELCELLAKRTAKWAKRTEKWAKRMLRLTYHRSNTQLTINKIPLV